MIFSGNTWNPATGGQKTQGTKSPKNSRKKKSIPILNVSREINYPLHGRQSRRQEQQRSSRFQSLCMFQKNPFSNGFLFLIIITISLYKVAHQLPKLVFRSH